MSALDTIVSSDQELLRVRHELAAAEQLGDGHKSSELHAQLENLDGYTAETRAARLLHGLGFSPRQHHSAVDRFSGGWRVRIGLACALFKSSDLLLLDEPTNHLDMEAIVWLEQWLKAYAGAVLLISHDRDFLDGVTTHTAYFDGGRVTCLAGNYSQSESKRALQLAEQTAKYKKQQTQARHLQQFVDRFRYKATKARQAQSRLKMLERLSAEAPAHAAAGYSFEFLAPVKLSTPLLRIEEIDAGYASNMVLSKVSLSIEPGDRYGLLGANGAGKSTLLHVLTGKLPILAGERTAGPNLAMGYFAQHQIDQLDYLKSPCEHLLALDPKMPEQQARNFLGGFGFHGDAAIEAIAPRSGGEKSRLGLALLASRRPNLLILDEPTNHLDLEMRHSLALALQDFAGAMVLVSHDRALLTACCDRFLVISNGELTKFDGDLSDYSRTIRRMQAEQTGGSSNTGNSKRQRRQDAAEERNKTRNLRKTVRRLEHAIEQGQQELDRIQIKLGDSTLYAEGNHQMAADLNQAAGELRKNLLCWEEQWLKEHEALERAVGRTQVESAADPTNC